MIMARRDITYPEFLMERLQIPAVHRQTTIGRDQNVEETNGI